VGAGLQSIRVLLSLVTRRCNAQLSRHLHHALVAHGSAFRPFPEPHRSTIVSIPVADTEAVMARLRAANVVAAVRAGRVRLSLHFYNLEEELDRVAELIGAVDHRTHQSPAHIGAR
jgi:selenocysteine lyase/cysteine desulfurase